MYRVDLEAVVQQIVYEGKLEQLTEALLSYVSFPEPGVNLLPLWELADLEELNHAVAKPIRKRLKAQRAYVFPKES